MAIVFGVERFHTYVFGRTFTAYTDHKPLEQIQRKTLADTPVHLQQMLLRLQGYDCTIMYHPGKEMLLADTLSRYALLSSSEIELNVTIHHVCIGDTPKASLQELTRTDLLLRSLAETIIDGRPEDPKDIPEALQPYWNHRDTMTVEDGIILRGEAILVPPAERGEILQQIHEGHQGITKSQLRTRNCVYWPGINKDIQCMIEACETCQHF